jgi:hypothetical protein
MTILVSNDKVLASRTKEEEGLLEARKMERGRKKSREALYRGKSEITSYVGSTVERQEPWLSEEEFGKAMNCIVLLVPFT